MVITTKNIQPSIQANLHTNANVNYQSKRQSFWTGIFWKTLSCALFSGVNALVRYLSGGSAIPLDQPLPVYMIMFYQSIIGTLFLTAILLKTNAWHQLLAMQRINLHLARGATAVSGMGLWYLSFKYLPLAEVVAIGFLAPALTIIGAILILRERLTWQRMLTFALSSVGIFFMSRPDLKLHNSAINWIMLLPIIATALLALDKIAIRKLLVLKENSLCITFLLLLFMTIASLLPSIHYGWVTPNSSNWYWLCLLAVLGGTAHFSFSQAYRYTEVTTLIPFSMSKLIFCSLAGYLAFGEYPHSWEIWLGIITLTSCTLIFKYQPEKPIVKAIPIHKK